MRQKVVQYIRQTEVLVPTMVYSVVVKEMLNHQLKEM